jgi:UDP-2,4-diacetamido-2,4,6-trideoxy-beta-L-altropyranose hydrolase
MAQLMSDSDLAIGAAGATSWERCCLGLPTIVAVLSENQILAARRMEHARAVYRIELGINISRHLSQFIEELANSEVSFARLSDYCSKIADGRGCERVVEQLMQVINL